MIKTTEIKLPTPIYKKIALIRSSIIGTIGGRVSFDNEETSKVIIFKWQKRDPVRNKMLDFDYVITYFDLNTVKDPINYGNLIAKKIKASLEEKYG